MSGDPEDPLATPDPARPDRQSVPSGPTSGDRAADASPTAPERSAAARYAGVGFQFGFAILAFLWLGSWLDRKFGTAPVFLILGVFLGGGAAFYSMYRQLMANLERDEAAKRARSNKGER